MSGKTVSIFVLRVHYDNHTYRFVGPTPDRKKLGLNPKCLAALDRLHELYDAFIGDKEGKSSVTITTQLRGERLPDLVPLVEESRRALDGGQETSPPVATPTSQAKKKPTVPPMTAQKPASLIANSEAPSLIPRVAPPLPVTKPGTSKSVSGVPRPAANTEKASNSVNTSPNKSTPTSAPRLGYLMLACPSPKKSAEWYMRLFQIKPIKKTQDSSLVEFELGGLNLALQNDLSKEERKLYGFGSVSNHRGWGALYVVSVPDFDLCLRRAKKLAKAVVSENKEASTFVVRDPAGYLLEVKKS